MYGYSKLELMLWFLFWSFLGFVLMFLTGLAYRRKRVRVSVGLTWPTPLSEREIEAIQRDAPEMPSATLTKCGSLIFGFKVEAEIFIEFQRLW